MEYKFPCGLEVGSLSWEDFYSVPFILDANIVGYCFTHDKSSKDFCYDTIENTIFAFISDMPVGSIEIHCFDFGIKNSFPYLSYLKSQKLYHLSSRKSAKEDFEVLVEKARKIHHEILTPDTPTLRQHNQKSNFKEKHHLLLINLEQFPDELISFGEIKAFFESCCEAGFLTIAYMNNDFQPKSDSAKYLYKVLSEVAIKNNKITITKELFPSLALYDRYTYHPLEIDTHTRKEHFFSKIDKLVSDRPDFLSVEVGTSLDGREKRYFRLGDESEAFHAFITGKSGSGKTTLLNNIITSIATNYTPDQIKLYLMDYKLGTEFGLYENHPNCEKIYLDNSNTQAAISMLEEFVSIFKEREGLFKRLGVSDIASYNKLKPQNIIPYCILIIDEVHKLFSDGFDYKEQKYFNSLLESIAKQGRSFGLHLILTTQSLDGVNIERSTMNQISLRISYKLQDHMEAMKIFNENNTKEVLTLEKYVFIYNSKGGIKDANQYSRATYQSREDIKAKINEVRKANNYIHKPVIIEKNSSADDSINPQTKHEEQLPPQENKPDDFINHDFDTSSEKALLEKLKAFEGKL